MHHLNAKLAYMYTVHTTYANVTIIMLRHGNFLPGRIRQIFLPSNVKGGNEALGINCRIFNINLHVIVAAPRAQLRPRSTLEQNINRG